MMAKSIFKPARWLAVVGLVAGLAACKQPLYEGLTEREANEIVAVLIRDGISVRKEIKKEGAVTILVDESKFADAVDLLKRHSLPRAKHQDFGEVFKKGGLLSSPLEERARFIYARSQEVSGTISHIDGVLDARVHVVPPADGSPGQLEAQGEASVFIRYDSAFVLDDIMPQIKRLVANSIEAVPYENVSVLMLPVNLNEGDAGVAGPALVSILGVEVAESSASAMRWLIFALAAVVLGLLAVASFSASRGTMFSGLLSKQRLNSFLMGVRKVGPS